MANIYNTVGNTLVSGTSKADYIFNPDWQDVTNVTISGGAGHDKISLSSYIQQAFQVLI